MQRQQTISLQPLVMLAGFILQILTMLLVFGMGRSLHRLSNTSTPTLVQTSDGRAFKANPIPGASRAPATVKAFISSILPQLFNLSGEIVTDDGETAPDPGITLATESSNGSNQKVSTAAAAASFALSSDFRLPYLKKLAELTPPGVFTGQTKVVMVVEQVSEPEEIATGKWKLSVLAHLNVFNGNNALQKTIPFHREVVVESTSAPLMPEGETPLEQAVYAIRQSGLQITDIRAIAQ